MENTAEARNVTKRYGDHVVVEDLSFSIPTGSVVGLIGPNGAGKTTVMKMLLGLVRPTNGGIDLLDTAVGGPRWGQALKRVGSMIEEPPIYKGMTARQNLRYQSIAVTGSVHDDEIERILRLVDLADRADDRPHKYSLGMKQRLGIGISLIGRPDFVILDEPANGLDPAGILEIRQLLRRLPEEGTTVLVSSHQLAEVQQACDRLVVIADGRLVTESDTQAVLEAGVSDEFVVTVPTLAFSAAADICRGAGFGVTDPGDGELLVTPLVGMGGSDINRELADAGIYASSISRRTISLEEAFLQLVNEQPLADEAIVPEGVAA